MAACQKELAGKSIHWVAVVSSSETPADVQAAVAESGIRMPVLFDENDALYDQLGVRLHPMVGIADAKFQVVAMEAYRQIEYCDIIRTQIKVLLGEATQAQLDATMNPAASELPGADLMKKAMRDVNMARKLIEIGEYAEAVKFAQKGLMVAPVAEGVHPARARLREARQVRRRDEGVRPGAEAEPRRRRRRVGQGGLQVGDSGLERGPVEDPLAQVREGDAEAGGDLRHERGRRSCPAAC